MLKEETEIRRPLLRYCGGKWSIANWITSNFPIHKKYVEPFGGAASVLLKKPRSLHEVYNDVDDSVVNLLTILRNKKKAYLLKARRIMNKRLKFLISC